MSNTDSDLRFAIKVNSVTKAEEALQAGADVNCLEDGATCLSLAAYLGRIQMVRWLLDNKAKVKVPGSRNPLVAALETNFLYWKSRLPAAMKWFQLQKQHSPEAQVTDCIIHDPLEAEERIQVARLLLQHGADLEPGTLHYAAALGLEDIAAECVRRGADINATADLYIETSYSRGKKHPQSVTPLFLATQFQFLSMMEILLRHGADPNVQSSVTPLQLAVEWGNTRAIEMLLKSGANPNVTNGLGESPLHLVSKAGNVQVMKCLIRHGANIHRRSKAGHTPLYYATLQGVNDAAELLLHKGSDPASQAPDRKTQLAKALRNAVLHGWAPEWHVHGMGVHCIGIDVESGLLVSLAGCVCHHGTADNNLAIQEYIKRFGLPWNSRKRWLDVIFNPQHYFEQQSRSREPLRLEHGSLVVADDGLTSLKMIPRGLQVRSTKFAPEMEQRLEDFQFRPPRRGAKLPILGQEWSRKAKKRILDGTESEFFWGPPGSELAVFKSDSGYAVLDLLYLVWLQPIPLGVTHQLDGVYGGDWHSRKVRWDLTS